MAKRIVRSFGWKPDKVDKRDLLMAVPFSIPEQFPEKVDLRKEMPEVYNQGKLGSCHDDKTEVLTDRGWVLFSDATMDDKLATVDPATKTVSFVSPVRLVCYDFDGDMYTHTGSTKNFAVTPDHKMLVRTWDESVRSLNRSYDFVPASDIGWYAGLMTGVVTVNPDVDTVTIPGVEHKHKPQRASKTYNAEAWLQLLGLYLAEGTMLHAKNHYGFQIAATKEREKAFARSVFRRLDICALELEDRFTFNNKQIYYAYRNYGLYRVHAPEKFVPDFVFNLGPKNMKAVLSGHLAGDGCIQNNSASHYTSSQRLANDLQRLIFLSGGTGSVNRREPRTSITKDGRVIVGRYPEFRVSNYYDIRQSIERDTIVTRRYVGPVYCAEVEPHHTLVTRREGRILISGNCTANAVGANMQFGMMKQKLSDVFVPSRLFTYYNTREYEGTVDEDCGATLRNTIKMVARHGVCPETEWKYDIKKFNVKPPAECYDHAIKHQALKYYRVPQSLRYMKFCLSSGYPFVFGFNVFENFNTREVAFDGVMDMPKGVQEGGHAVMAVGYDDKKSRMIVRNSWGDDWGDNGYFYMPYEYITSEELARDFWVIVTVEG